MFAQVICRIILCILGGFAYLCAKAPVVDSSLVEKDPVFADFCFYRDTSTFVAEDSAFVLSYYEMENELSITMNFESTSYSSGFGVKLPNLDMNKIRTDLLRGFERGGACFTRASNGKLYRGTTCSSRVDVSPYDLIDFFFSIKDSLYVKSLFGLETRLTWKYHFDMGMQKQEVNGDNIIYISGFCTEEQLKAIRERKKGK